MSESVLNWLLIAGGRGKRTHLVQGSLMTLAKGPQPSPEEPSRRPNVRATIPPWIPLPNLESQSFSRGYGSILPTSLTYFRLETRGCEPWKPDAVMGTDEPHSILLPSIFKGRWLRTDHAEVARLCQHSNPISS